MVSLSAFKPDSYHQSMMDKLRGVSSVGQPSNAAAEVAAALTPESVKKSRVAAIKTPDAATVANAIKPKIAPVVMAPTGGIAPRDESTGQSVYRQPSSAGNSAGASGGLDNFLARVGKKESGGNYGAVNKDSGALGKYQVMPNNVAQWTKQALGRSISTREFLNSPEAQEAVAKTILGGYVQKYGEQGAAIAWYSGENNAKKFAKTGQVSTKSQGKYPSIASYAASLTGR